MEVLYFSSLQACAHLQSAGFISDSKNAEMVYNKITQFKLSSINYRFSIPSQNPATKKTRISRQQLKQVFILPEKQLNLN